MRLSVGSMLAPCELFAVFILYSGYEQEFEPKWNQWKIPFKAQIFRIFISFV